MPQEYSASDPRSDASGEVSPQGNAAQEESSQAQFPSASQTLRGALTGQAPELTPEDQAELHAAIRRRRVVMILAAAVIIVLGFVAGRTLRGDSEGAAGADRAGVASAMIVQADLSAVEPGSNGELSHKNVDSISARVGVLEGSEA